MSEHRPPPFDPLIDKVLLGRFKLLERLGAGGMGAVYVAEQLAIRGRRVAVKVLRSELAQNDEFVHRFRLEAERAATISHPRIVTVLDFGQAESGELFIVMEYIAGETLGDLSARGPVPIEQAVHLGAQLADALHCAHEAGVIHRDVKPLNVMIRQGSDDLVLMDFGIARDVEDKEHLTQTGLSMGTPRYMAPEQITGGAISRQTDIYAWGVLMYGLLANRLPFEAREAAALAYQHVHEPPPSLRKLRPEVSPALEAIVLTALAKDPAVRQRTMAEIAAALRALGAPSVERKAAPSPGATTQVQMSPLDGTTQVHRPSSAAPRPAPPRPAPPRPAAPAAAPGRSVAVASVLAAVVALAIGAKTFWPDPEIAPAPATAKATPGAEPDAAPQKGPPEAPLAATQQAPSPPSRGGIENIDFRPPVDDGDIAAVGMVDGTIGRYAKNPELLLTDLRADARHQALEKAVGIFVARGALNDQYKALKDEIFSHQELVEQLSDNAQPRRSETGLVYLPAKANVRIQDLRRLVFQKSRDQRIALIRAQGNPLISVSVSIRDAERGSPIERSALAENVIKQSIRDFGFRVATPGGTKAPDFAIESEAKLKRLSTRLAASGLTIEKYVLTSWTVKCSEQVTGEDIYFDNQLPKSRSWNDEDDALQEIGKQIADQFSQDFFAQHLPRASRYSELELMDVGSPEATRLIGRELLGLRSVVGVAMHEAEGGTATFGVNWYDQGPGGEQSFDSTVLAPLRRKLGADCLEVMSDLDAREVAVRLADKCAGDLVARLERLPPAALTDAPAGRLEDVARSLQIMQQLLAINPDGVNALAARGVPDAVTALQQAKTQKVDL